ncbi:MAG: hypothetical protein WCG04_01970 [Alphaproteobacteria bacterium]
MKTNTQITVNLLIKLMLILTLHGLFLSAEAASASSADNLPVPNENSTAGNPTIPPETPAESSESKDGKEKKGCNCRKD